ncbi:MAG: hypothetical protein IT355_13570 [Gemmatimonadaceae bacterium]|nr:hypothetical protein [Gemmatimonadaceae bacterium]
MLLSSLAIIGTPRAAVAQAAGVRRVPVESAEGLTLHRVSATAVVHGGQRAVRIQTSAETERDLAALPIAQQSQVDRLAVITGTDFMNGTIEAEVAGAPAPNAPAGARGFVGIAFRVQPDMRTYDAFYLRPTNGRAPEQERRNHAVQYISHPDWTWNRMRAETPSRYEAYVDLVPDAWTRIRIEVRGDTARLFVHGQRQPTLVVTDVKTGSAGRGAIALWIDAGTVAHFRAVRVRP